jgi:hypothetical protein
MEPLAGGGLRSWLEHGTGATLDDQSTLDATRAGLSADEERLAELTGNLASRSGFDAEAAVTEFGATFVLLGPAESTENREAVAAEQRARAALDGNPLLVPVGDTAFGALWRFADAPSPAPAAAIPPHAGGAATVLWTTLQLVVLGAVLLLSIPTGAGREIDRARPERARVRRERRPRGPRPGAAEGGAADGGAAEGAATDPGPGADVAADPDTPADSAEASTDPVPAAAEPVPADQRTGQTHAG